MNTYKQRGGGGGERIFEEEELVTRGELVTSDDTGVGEEGEDSEEEPKAEKDDVISEEVVRIKVILAKEATAGGVAPDTEGFFLGCAIVELFSAELIDVKFCKGLLKEGSVVEPL